MELPFKILNIHSNLMDKKEKPTTIEEYIDKYFLHHQPKTTYVDDESHHCDYSCNRSYSDLYMLVYNYFKTYYKIEISFEKFIYTITMMYKRNCEYLNKFRSTNNKLNNIQCFHCPDIDKFVSYKGCSSTTEGCFRTFNNDELPSKQNTFFDNIHYFYLDYPDEHKDLVKCKTLSKLYDAEEQDEEYEDGVTSEVLNNAFNEYSETIGYKIIAINDSLKFKGKNHNLLENENVIALGEFSLNTNCGKEIKMELYSLSNDMFEKINSFELSNKKKRLILNNENNKWICSLMVENINYYI